MKHKDKPILGVFGSSLKENEKRIPLYPSHIPVINPALKEQIYFESGYGRDMGMEEHVLREHSKGVLAREELFDACDILLLPKPVQEDFQCFKEGQVLWGWQHNVQGPQITQVGIDKKLTYIAWEAMHEWGQDGQRGQHTFYRNNELAGYCSVLHALSLTGVTGHYGPRKQVAVISFGSTARGAVHALQGVGFEDITVFTQRDPADVKDKIPGVSHRQYAPVAAGAENTVVRSATGNDKSFAEVLAGFDIIVNCILQETDAPLIFVSEGEDSMLKPETIIVDIGCDEKMGFHFARPTSFENPMFKVGNRIHYYAVDHTPAYLWRSASYEISNALLPFLETVLGEPEQWKQNLTIQHAIEIDEGRILNPKILHFQNRDEEYPHAMQS